VKGRHGAWQAADSVAMHTACKWRMFGLGVLVERFPGRQNKDARCRVLPFLCAPLTGLLHASYAPLRVAPRMPRVLALFLVCMLRVASLTSLHFLMSPAAFVIIWTHVCLRTPRYWSSFVILTVSRSRRLRGFSLLPRRTFISPGGGELAVSRNAFKPGAFCTARRAVTRIDAGGTG